MLRVRYHSHFKVQDSRTYKKRKNSEKLSYCTWKRLRIFLWLNFYTYSYFSHFKCSDMSTCSFYMNDLFCLTATAPPNAATTVSVMCVDQLLSGCWSLRLCLVISNPSQECQLHSLWLHSGLSYILVSVLVLVRAINPPDANAISNAKRTPDGVAEYEAVDSHTRSTTGPPCLKHYAGNQFPRPFTVELRPVVFTWCQSESFFQF